MHNDEIGAPIGSSSEGVSIQNAQIKSGETVNQGVVGSSPTWGAI